MVVEPGLGDQRGKRPHRLDDGREAGAELAGAGGMLAHGGGKPMQAVDDVELGLALGPPCQAGNRAVARAHVGIDVGQRLLRLDHQAAPAREIEPERDVVGDGMPAAYVDVGAGLLAGKDQIEVVVLEVLRIGELHHFACCVRGARRL